MQSSSEPSVLDYVKSLLRGKPLQLSESLSLPQVEHQPSVETQQPLPAQNTTSNFWESLKIPVTIGLVPLFALIAQFSFEPSPSGRDWLIGTILYLSSAMLAVWLAWRGILVVASPRSAEAIVLSEPAFYFHKRALYVALVFGMAAAFTMSANHLNTFNVLLWLIAILAIVFTFVPIPPPSKPLLATTARRILQFPHRIEINLFSFVFVLIFGIAIFFRFYQLQQVPPEMVSDQAEKLLDVWDVLHGQTSIFFPRNTGREMFQFYLTAAVIRVLGTDYSFLSLKIGTVLCGLLTLPYIYGIGNELANRRVGLFAMLFAGFGYWPNVVARAGLRYTLYPFFAAPALYYLIRGLRTRKTGDFILSGLFLGAGLHGYSPFRIVPFVVLAAMLIYLLSRNISRNDKKIALWGLLTIVAVSFFVFLPLFRYMLQNPEMVTYRMMTRMSDWERPIEQPILLLFFQNLWKAFRMFAWDNGEVWVISIPGRPAFDFISAALFHLGVVLLFWRFLRSKNWLDLFLLISIPILLLSSVLSFAFPAENPILNRTSAAFVPGFVLIGFALDSLMTSLTNHTRKFIPILAVLLLVVWSMVNNYRLVFVEYQNLYLQSAWNTTEMGMAVRDFQELFGSAENVWLVGYPHWADSRLVAINAGLIPRDIAIMPENLSTTTGLPGAKMFLLNLQDSTSLQTLQTLYPKNYIFTYPSKVAKDFVVFIALP